MNSCKLSIHQQRGAVFKPFWGQKIILEAYVCLCTFVYKLEAKTCFAVMDGWSSSSKLLWKTEISLIPHKLRLEQFYLFYIYFVFVPQDRCIENNVRLCAATCWAVYIGFWLQWFGACLMNRADRGKKRTKITQKHRREGSFTVKQQNPHLGIDGDG